MAVFVNFEILFNYVPKMLDRNLEFFFFCERGQFVQLPPDSPQPSSCLHVITRRKCNCNEKILSRPNHIKPKL